jgi:diaminopimelate decarboxylase
VSPRAQHHASVFDRFAAVDGCLAAGGTPLTRLAARVGETPFFVYDRALLTARVEALRAALPPAIHLSYAIKANPMPAVVQHMAGLVDGLDVASAREMQTALDTPMPAELISFAGPGKTDAELSRAIAAGITLNLESAGEMRRAAAAGRRLGLTPRAAVRVNPDFELKGAGMQMGGGPKAFGVDAEAVPDMLAELAGLGLDFRGFHIFGGSQNLNAEVIADIQEKTVDLALRLAEHAPAPPAMVNIGGGFGIPYFPGDAPLDLAAVGANLARLMPRVEAALPQARVIVELGRYLVGEAGLYVCRVVDVKDSRGKRFLVTDGGLHHQLAASGNFGQVVRRNYPLALANRADRPVEASAEVVGCLCTPIDVLGRAAELPAAEVGDLVAVFQSGAYGKTASPTDFLSHPPPPEILV